MEPYSLRTSRASLAVSTALIGLVCIPLSAQAQGWFTGGTVGTAIQNDYEVGGQIATRDDSDAGLRLFGGYLISPIQGLVVSYVDLGTAFYDGPAFGGFTDYLDADGIDISYIIGWAPGSQQRVSVFGTLGVFSWDQDVRYTDVTGTYLFADEGTSFSMGFGTSINFSAAGTSAWGLNVEYQLFKDVGDFNNSGHEYDREMFSVGVDYRFGRQD
jgi:hypothetical protein